MAKRMKSKIQPAELKLAFTINESGKNYLDISQAASLINRRFYRQGLNWAVSHFTFYKNSPTETGSAGVSVAKLPTSWIMSNAWEKAFRAWQKMNNEALAENPSVKPKFLDFKIYANADHHQLGFARNLLPTDIQGNTITPGEWESSKLRIPDTTVLGNTRDREMIAIGASYPGNGATGQNAVSLIEGYAASRGLPNIVDPNTPDDAADADGVAPENWMSALFNQGTEQTDEVIADMISENNLAPYPFENDGTSTDTMYPGGANQLPDMRIVGASFFNAGTNANKVTIEGDTFPCGLVEINNSTSDTIQMIVHLVPGNHRGYLAESMVEM